MLELRRPPRERARSLPLLLALLVTVALTAAACSNGKKTTVTNGSVGSTAAATSGETTATSAPQASAAAPSATPDTAALAEFSLPKFNVSGKIVVKGVDPATNTMQSPDNKDDVAYYDFTPRPGFGCQAPDKCANTVLSGHVDWFTGQVGVFWHLKDIKEGDEIDLKLEDGKKYKYKVMSNKVVTVEQAPVTEIIGDTPQESVTLITCDGVFNKALQEYNSRRIVRAVREQ